MISEVYYKGMYICKSNYDIKNIEVQNTACDTNTESVYVFVEIQLNGGSAEDKSGTYKEGTIIDLEIPTKENETFKEWKILKGNSILEGNKLTIGSEDTIVFAEYESHNNLLIELDGGIIAEDKSGIYKSGTNIDLGTPTKEGYIFIRWEIEEGSGELSGNLFTMGG